MILKRHVALGIVHGLLHVRPVYRSLSYEASFDPYFVYYSIVSLNSIILIIADIWGMKIQLSLGKHRI